jgi:hypothetical protein
MEIFTSTPPPIHYLVQKQVVPGQQGYPWLVRQELLEQQVYKVYKDQQVLLELLGLKVFRE